MDGQHCSFLIDGQIFGQVRSTVRVSLKVVGSCPSVTAVDLDVVWWNRRPCKMAELGSSCPLWAPLLDRVRVRVRVLYRPYCSFEIADGRMIRRRRRSC